MKKPTKKGQKKKQYQEAGHIFEANSGLKSGPKKARVQRVMSIVCGSTPSA